MNSALCLPQTQNTFVCAASVFLQRKSLNKLDFCELNRSLKHATEQVLKRLKDATRMISKLSQSVANHRGEHFLWKREKGTLTTQLKLALLRFKFCLDKPKNC